MYLYFATVVGDFQRVVEHWIMEEEWLKAIDVINRQVLVVSCFVCYHLTRLFARRISSSITTLPLL